MADFRRYPGLVLFVGGVFFGGGMDHLLFIVRDSPVSHYGLRISPLGQFGFAALDFAIAGGAIGIYRRWRREQNNRT